MYLLRTGGTQPCFIPDDGAVCAAFSLEHPNGANECRIMGGLGHLEGLLGLVISQLLVYSLQPKLCFRPFHRLPVRWRIVVSDGVVHGKFPGWVRASASGL